MSRRGRRQRLDCTPSHSPRGEADQRLDDLHIQSASLPETAVLVTLVLECSNSPLRPGQNPTHVKCIDTGWQVHMTQIWAKGVARHTHAMYQGVRHYCLY